MSELTALLIQQMSDLKAVQEVQAQYLGLLYARLVDVKPAEVLDRMKAMAAERSVEYSRQAAAELDALQKRRDALHKPPAPPV